MNYFDRYEYTSNSDLSALKKARWNIEDHPNLEHVFSFGNLVDAKISEPESVERYAVNHTDEEIAKAELMKQAYNNDASLKVMFRNPQYQKEFYRERFKIEHEGFTIYMKAKCKFDVIARPLSGDIKTTAATTQEQFNAAFYRFDWDRAAAWYMDIGQVDAMLFIGIGKKANKYGKHPIFKKTVQRGDADYLSGKAKYNELAFYYFFTVQNLLFQCKHQSQLP